MYPRHRLPGNWVSLGERFTRTSEADCLRRAVAHKTLIGVSGGVGSGAIAVGANGVTARCGEP